MYVRFLTVEDVHTSLALRLLKCHHFSRDAEVVEVRRVTGVVASREIEAVCRCCTCYICKVNLLYHLYDCVAFYF